MMMVSEYHNQIEMAILEWCSQSNKIRKTFKGNKSPLSITDAHTKLVINYKPDVYAIKTNNKKIIFEILESELKKQDSIIADVIRSCLVENVGYIIFILPSDSDADRSRVLEALHTIIRGLNIRLEVPRKELPGGAVYTILRDQAKDTKKVVDLLQRYSEGDKW